MIDERNESSRSPRIADRPLAVETRADPIVATGEILVDVVAAPVLSSANDVFSGDRKYPLSLPTILGGGRSYP